MKDNMNLACKAPPEITSLLERAADFHGHLGPFLVIGARIGLIGLKKMDKNNSEEFGRKRITIDASLPLHVPFSCIIDGLQFTTRCTVGNQKLSLRDSDSIQVRFRRENDGMEVTVALNKSMFEELKSELLGEAMPEEEVRRLAYVVAGISEADLFEIS